jgi:hypothetical protein
VDFHIGSDLDAVPNTKSASGHVPTHQWMESEAQDLGLFCHSCLINDTSALRAAFGRLFLYASILTGATEKHDCHAGIKLDFS